MKRTRQILKLLKSKRLHAPNIKIDWLFASGRIIKIYIRYDEDEKEKVKNEE